MKKLLITIITIMLSLSAIMPTGVNASTELVFDKTNVYDDLLSQTSFDASKYKYDKEKDIELISLAEYCFSYYHNANSNYGLYLYIYNPKALSIKQAGSAVTIVSKYEDNKPVEYTKYPLQLLSVSEQSDNYRVLMKFKVIDLKGEILERVKASEKRQYGVSEIELTTAGDTNAKAEGIGQTFTFTGYSKGYGEDKQAASTLKCITDKLETVDLAVTSTYYRYQNNVGSATQISSVYFSAPNDLFTNYGKLEQLSAMWYECQTAPVIVTEDTNFYNYIEPYIGVDIGLYNQKVEYSLIEPVLKYWGYNVNGIAFNNATKLSYVFSKLRGQSISSEEMKTYINNYSAGKDNLLLDKYSNDLFEQNVDEGRTQGWNTKTIDINSTYDLEGFCSDSDLLSWWLNIFYDLETEDIKGIKPIVTVELADLIGTDKQVGKRLFIMEEDVGAFKEYARTELAKGRSVVLFRFAQTQYSATNIEARKGILLPDPIRRTYMAKETVFLNFDILSLTFNDGKELTVIGAVSSPIDIIHGIDPPPSFGDGLFDNWDKFDWEAIVMSLVIPLIAMLVLKLLFANSRNLGWIYTLGSVICVIFMALVVCQLFGVINIGLMEYLYV